MRYITLTQIEQLNNSSNFEELKEVLINLRDISKEYYLEEDFFHPQYEEYISSLYYYRNKMNTEYICDVSVIEKDILKEDILNYVVAEFQKYLLYFFKDRYTSINEVDVTNGCIIASFKIKEICDKFGIDCKVAQIAPGYKQNSRIFNSGGYHYLNIVTIDNEEYLIDTTYKQFFKKSKCLLEEIGVPLMCAPDPGTFMTMSEERMQIANKILRDGWIKLEKNTLKNYCDGFTLSFRNGLYYDYFKPKGYETNYNDEDYKRFLTGEDNQINHEPLECLGHLRQLCKKKI